MARGERMRRAAKICKGKKKTAFRACMRKELKKGGKRRRRRRRR